MLLIFLIKITKLKDLTTYFEKNTFKLEINKQIEILTEINELFETKIDSNLPESEQVEMMDQVNSHN